MDNSALTIPTNVKDLNINPELCRRFCTLSSRYLNLDIKHFNSQKTLNSKLSVQIETVCDDCKQIVSSFCSIYDQICKLELHLNVNIDEVCAIMKNADKKDSPNAVWRNTLAEKLKKASGDMVEIEEFRTEFVEAAAKMKKETLPQVRVMPLTQQQLPVSTEVQYSSDDEDYFEEVPKNFEMGEVSPEGHDQLESPSYSSFSSQEMEVDEQPTLGKRKAAADDLEKGVCESREDKESGISENESVFTTFKRRKADYNPTSLPFMTTIDDVPPQVQSTTEIDATNDIAERETFPTKGQGVDYVLELVLIEDPQYHDLEMDTSDENADKLTSESETLSDFDYEEYTTMLDEHHRFNRDKGLEADCGPQAWTIQESTLFNILQFTEDRVLGQDENTATTTSNEANLQAEIPNNDCINNTALKCPKCPKTFRTRFGLKIHDDAIHINAKNYYGCPYCGSFHKYRHFFVQHLRRPPVRCLELRRQESSDLEAFEIEHCLWETV